MLIFFCQIITKPNCKLSKAVKNTFVQKKSHKMLVKLTPVCHVSTVVNAQPHGDDEVDAGHGVHGEAPEVHKSANVSQRQDDHLR